MSANIKVKFIGSSARFTTNAEYRVISANGEASLLVLDDNGELFGSVNPSGPDWELVSITYPGEVQIYP